MNGQVGESARVLKKERQMDGLVLLFHAAVFCLCP